MAMQDEQRRGLESRLEMIRELLALPTVEKHETRFDNEVALAASATEREAVAAVVEKHVGPPRDPAEGGDLDGLLAAMGGVRGNQTLYVQDLGSGLLLYVAFWPWGGGSRFTIKLGVYERAPSGS